MKILKNLNIDRSWTLFLDRDGVINKKRHNDYVKSWSEFEFIPGVLEALALLSSKFSTIVIATNQQGVGKGLYTVEDLNVIHQKMMELIKQSGGRIDAIYFCSALEIENNDCRKPNTGMALQAKREFTNIDFSKSIMVGDAESDMIFGNSLGMICAYIHAQPVEKIKKLAHVQFNSLLDFARDF